MVHKRECASRPWKCLLNYAWPSFRLSRSGWAYWVRICFSNKLPAVLLVQGQPTLALPVCSYVMWEAAHEDRPGLCSLSVLCTLDCKPQQSLCDRKVSPGQFRWSVSSANLSAGDQRSKASQTPGRARESLPAPPQQILTRRPVVWLPGVCGQHRPRSSQFPGSGLGLRAWEWAQPGPRAVIKQV